METKRYIAKKGSTPKARTVYHTREDCSPGIEEAPDAVIEFYNMELCMKCYNRDNRIEAVDVIATAITDSVGCTYTADRAKLVIEALEKHGYKIRAERKSLARRKQETVWCGSLNTHHAHFYGDGAIWCEGTDG